MIKPSLVKFNEVYFFFIDSFITQIRSNNLNIVGSFDFVQIIPSELFIIIMRFSEVKDTFLDLKVGRVELIVLLLISNHAKRLKLGLAHCSSKIFIICFVRLGYE